MKSFTNFDQIMMQEALKEAQKAFDKKEVPVGAVLTQGKKVLARTHNQVEERKDATAHAELLCVQEGAKVLGDWRLLQTVLYTTLEPCVMCAGALLLSRVSRIVWGAPDLRHGAQGSWVNLFDKKHPTHTLEIVGGLCEAESAALMRQFFTKRRKIT